MKNYKIREFRVSAEMAKLFLEAKQGLGVTHAELARLCINTAIKKLKSDSIQAGGYDKLSIIVKDLQ